MTSPTHVGTPDYEEFVDDEEERLKDLFGDDEAPYDHAYEVSVPASDASKTTQRRA